MQSGLIGTLAREVPRWLLGRVSDVIGWIYGQRLLFESESTRKWLSDGVIMRMKERVTRKGGRGGE